MTEKIREIDTDIESRIIGILKKVSEKIIPTPSELKKIDNAVRYIKDVILNSDIPDEISINFIEPQGSTGIKQTSIRNASDIDLFIGLNPALVLERDFPSKSKMREFLKGKFKELIITWLIPVLKAAELEDVDMSYADHPYISARYKGLDLDIVFCFDIDRSYLMEYGPITAVDRTPHHSRFVRDRLTDEMRNDVRLLKYFFKCNYCYGDKSAVGRTGFMGYAAELLIIYYGGLLELLKNFSGLKDKVIHFFNEDLFKYPEDKRELIDMYKNKSPDFIREKMFQNQTLLIIDPTDFKRNVGASISRRAYYYMDSIIGDFISSPSSEFFEMKPLPSISTMVSDKNVLKCYFYGDYKLVEEDHYTKIRDRLYSLLEKTVSNASIEPLGNERFKDVKGELIIDTDHNRYCLAFYTSTPKISDEFLRIGPHVKAHEENIRKFLKKYPKAFIHNGHYCFYKKREFTDFGKFISSFLGKRPIKNLKLVDTGCALNSSPSIWANRAMGILYEINRRGID